MMQINALAGPSRPHLSPLHGPSASQSPANSSSDVSPSYHNNNNTTDDRRGSNSPNVDFPGQVDSKHRPRFKRSTKGCLTCRSQKVKCDEVQPVCNRCEAAQRSCEWPSAEKLARPRKRRRKVIPHDDGEARTDSERSVAKVDGTHPIGGSYDHRDRGTNGDRAFDLGFSRPPSPTGFHGTPEWLLRSDFDKHDVHKVEYPTQVVDPTHAIVDNRYGSYGPVSAERMSSWLDAAPSYRDAPLDSVALPRPRIPDIGRSTHRIHGDPDLSVSGFDLDVELRQQSSARLQPIPIIPHSLPLNLALLTDFPLPPNTHGDVGGSRDAAQHPLQTVHVESSNFSDRDQYNQSPGGHPYSSVPSPKTPNFGGNALEHSLLAHRRRVRSGIGGSGGSGGIMDAGSACSLRSFEEVKVVHGINIEALANAAENDPYLVEQGPFTHQAVTAPASLAALTSAFPSPFSLQLFHHFFNYTTRILITMGDIGPNPHLTLCTPARLLDTGSAASAALRMSMLTTSIAHLVHAAEGGPLSIEPMRRWGEVKDRLLRLGDRFRRAALQNVVLSDNDEKDQFDTILATCVLLMIRDIISAGSSWQENMEYAIQLVFKRGGAASLISREPQNFMRRFLIENLLVHNVFSCFVTNKEPALLNKFDPWWFECQEFSKTRWEWESVERTFGISRGMVEIISRVVSLNAQKKRLGIDFRRGRGAGTGAGIGVISPNGSGGYDNHKPDDIYNNNNNNNEDRDRAGRQRHPHSSPSSIHTPSSIPIPSIAIPLAAHHRSASSQQIEAHLTQQAESLLAELDVLGNGLGWVPRNYRVSCGDILYRYMVIVYILGDILERPPTHPRIITSIAHCLELCSEASAMRMSVMLIWPLLICGTFATRPPSSAFGSNEGANGASGVGNEDGIGDERGLGCEGEVRDKVRSLFDAFAWDYCDDLKAARILMDAQWRSMDEGRGRQSWAALMQSLGMSVLVI